MDEPPLSWPPQLVERLVSFGLARDILDQCEHLARATGGSARADSDLGAVMEVAGKCVSLSEILAWHVAVFIRSAILRQAALWEGIFSGTAMEATLTVALCSRALVESAAAVAYWREALLRALDEEGSGFKPDGAVAVCLKRMVTGSRFDWRAQSASALEFNKDLVARFAEESPPEPELRVPNVLTMLRTLQERIAGRAPASAGLIPFAYAYLSDICHPALGGYQLFSGTRDGKVVLEMGKARGILPLVLRDIVPALALCGASAADDLEAFRALRRTLA